MIPKKQFYIENGRNFIRYGGKPGMIIEVFDYSTEIEMTKAMKLKFAELEIAGLPNYGASTIWNGKYYLLIATKFLDEMPTTLEQYSIRMTRVMQKLAEWYRYTVLMD